MYSLTQVLSKKGVPISAIIFGGRRPKGIPLVFESLDWNHGVFLGASMRSEATAAAEHKCKTIMHDPFAMRPFFGYNFGDYLKHWISLNQPGRTMPKIFHVNWFRKSNDGEGSFLWPGFGENIRVLEWIFKRIDNVSGIASNSPIGFIPSSDSINLTGANVTNEQFCQLFKLEKNFLFKEVDEIMTYFDDNLGSSTPKEIKIQIQNLKTRIEKMDD